MYADRKKQIMHARRGVVNANRPADQRQRTVMRMALSSALGETGDFDGCIAQCRTVLAGAPQHIQARLNLGFALLESRNPGGDDAEACVQLMMALDLPADDARGVNSALKEMALDDLLFALGRRMQRCHEDGDAEGARSLEKQLARLIERHPEATRRCAARGQLRAMGLDV